MEGNAGVKTLDGSIVNAHAGIDLAAMVPDFVPWTSRCMGQFSQNSSAESAINGTYARQQLLGGGIEFVRNNLLSAGQWTDPVGPVPDRAGAKPFELTVQVLQYGSVLPRLKRVPYQRPAEFYECPDVAEVDDFL